MRNLTLVIALALLAQLAGTISKPAGGATPVSITNSDATTTPCTNGGIDCTMSIVVGATGDAVGSSVSFCIDGGCTTDASACVISVADTTNTYAEIATTAVNTADYNIRRFGAKNAIAGSYTLTWSISGSGCTWNYVAMDYEDFLHANTTTPFDTSVSNNATGTSATPSITSSGNVGASGEVIVATLNTANTYTNASPFSVLHTLSTLGAIVQLAAPTSGSPVTANATQASGKFWFSMYGVKP